MDNNEQSSLTEFPYVRKVLKSEITERVSNKAMGGLIPLNGLFRVSTDLLCSYGLAVAPTHTDVPQSELMHHFSDHDGIWYQKAMYVPKPGNKFRVEAFSIAFEIATDDAIIREYVNNIQAIQCIVNIGTDDEITYVKDLPKDMDLIQVITTIIPQNVEFIGTNVTVSIKFVEGYNPTEKITTDDLDIDITITDVSSLVPNYSTPEYGCAPDEVYVFDTKLFNEHMEAKAYENDLVDIKDEVLKHINDILTPLVNSLEEKKVSYEQKFNELDLLKKEYEKSLVNFENYTNEKKLEGNSTGVILEEQLLINKETANAFTSINNTILETAKNFTDLYNTLVEKNNGIVDTVGNMKVDIDKILKEQKKEHSYILGKRYVFNEAVKLERPIKANSNKTVLENNSSVPVKVIAPDGMNFIISGEQHSDFTFSESVVTITLQGNKLIVSE